MRPLPLCCSDDSQKCEWKIMNTEETQRKQNKEKKLQFENTILVPWIFLEPFAILLTFQNFVIITMSTLRPWTMHDVRFSSAD